MKKRKAQKEKIRLFLFRSMFLLCLVLIVVYIFQRIGKNQESQEETAHVDEITFQSKVTKEPEESSPVPSIDTKDFTDQIYTYLQGPKSWRRGIDWSGEWGEARMNRGYFGGFGCGLCCMANIYSSLTDYQCSPIDMYRFSKRHSGYQGGMAIGWGYMKYSMVQLGFDCYVANKPDTFEEFEEEIKGAQAAVVLVSSKASKVYWKNTPGHYVTIFAYNEKNKKIFLADSGNPDHNRHWVKLNKIYRSLKTESEWQYLVVKNYDKKNDVWHHKTTTGTWHRPSTLQK